MLEGLLMREIKFANAPSIQEGEIEVCSPITQVRAIMNADSTSILRCEECFDKGHISCLVVCLVVCV